MTGSMVVSLTLPGGERCQYDLQAQDDRYSMSFDASRRNHASSCPASRRPRTLLNSGPVIAHLLDAAAGRLGQYQIEPVLREGLEVPDQRGVVRDGLAVPGRPHVAQVRFDPAVGPVVRHSASRQSPVFAWSGSRGGPCCSLPDAGRGSPGSPRSTSSSDEMPRLPLQVQRQYLSRLLCVLIAACRRSRSKNVAGRFPRGQGGITHQPLNAGFV